jgi:putative Mg2+ transporter-C (MgtC) family protein
MESGKQDREEFCMLNELFDPHSTQWLSYLARLLAAVLAGGVIGLERERHSQPAGFRTHIVICAASALLTIVSVEGAILFSGSYSVDPTRIAAQIVTGIGFLGAGAIMRFGANIRGLTTAATIWGVAAVGMALGMGLWRVGFLAALILLFTLSALDFVEKKILATWMMRSLTVKFDTEKTAVRDVCGTLASAGIAVKSHSLTFASGRTETTCTVKLMVKMKRTADPQKIFEELRRRHDIVSLVLE